MKKANLFNILVFLVIGIVSFILLYDGGPQYFTKRDFLAWKIEQKKNQKPTSGFPDEAMKWYYEQRAYPIGHIPEGWRQEALDHIAIYNQSQENSPLSLNWSQLGPGNIPGRTRSVIVDPGNSNIMYSGAVSGGVWKTTNGGSSWFPLKDNMENLAVCSMVMDPSNSTVIYAGTGEGFYNGDAIRGEGIFKTTNGGSSWTQLSATMNSNYYYVNRLVFDNTTSTLWAGTRRGLFKSTNGGSSFISVLGGGNVDCMDVDIANSSPTTIYATFGSFSSSTIWRSTDAGSSWSQNYSVTNTGRIELAVAPSNSNVVYASFLDLNSASSTYFGVGFMATTTNGGSSWSSITVPGPSYSGASNYAGTQAWYDNILAVDPNNQNTLYAGGIDFWKSTDGGSSWTQKTNWYVQGGAPPYVHADHHAIAFDPSNSNILYLGTDNGIFKTTDGGNTWTNLHNNIYTTQFYYGAVDPVSNKYYGGTQDNGTLKSTGSTTWSVIMGGDGGATEIDFNNTNTIYMEYVNLAFFKSTDGGSSFFKAMTGIPAGPNFWDGTTDRTLFISPFSMDPNSSSTIVAGTYRVFRTTDGASNWNAVSTDLTGDGSGSNGAKVSTVVVASGNSSVIYAGCSNGKVKVTTNTGSSWTDVSSGLPTLYCTRIAIEPNNSSTAFATFSGFSAGQKVYKTTNSGSSWTNISGNLPNIPVNCIVVDPSSANNLIVGTDLGIFVSNNGGSSWVKRNDGMANVPVADLDYRSSDGNVFAATHGRGMFSAPLSDVVSVKDESEFPANFVLEQNYPNPFNPSTTINFSLPQTESVNVRIYNTVGEEVFELVNSQLGAGTHSLKFDARTLAGGVYYYRIKAGNFNAVKKMVLLK
jgi:photosystem II stability/assembly factor-like uncharacterized protein